MTLTRRRPPAWAVLALAALLAAVPACNSKKKKDTGSSNDSGGTTDTDRPSGEPPGDRPVAGLPAPPAPGTIVTTGWTDLELPAERMRSSNNLKQIAIAFHNAHDTMGRLPAGFYDPAGKKLVLSWRVAILPYLEQENLYRQFKLDEPWDSEHNKKLIAQIPKAYMPPGNTVAAGYTYYRGFTGGGAVLNPEPGRPGQPGQPNYAFGLSFSRIPDGTSNTFLVAEAADPVIWTKPDDLPFDPKGPPPKLGGVFEAGFTVAMCDGSTRFFRKGSLDEKTLRHLIDARDGNVINFP
jgi:hypothetical protein